MRELLLKPLPVVWLGRLDVIGAALFALSLIPLGTDAFFPVLALLAWCVLAKVSGFSMTLVSSLLVVSVVPLHDKLALPLPFYGIMALGVLPWALGEKRSDRAAAFVSGIMWTSVALAIPGLLPLVCLGYPRLSRMYPLYAGWTRWPGVLLLGSALVWILISGEVPAAFGRAGDPDHYLEWGRAWATFFTNLTLWTVIPFVGVFEIAQRQPEDLRMTWRHLPILGCLLSICMLDPSVGLAFFLAVALPLSAIMLTRWGFALHSLWMRRGYWLLLGTSAFLTLI